MSAYRDPLPREAAPRRWQTWPRLRSLGAWAHEERYPIAFAIALSFIGCYLSYATGGIIDRPGVCYIERAWGTVNLMAKEPLAQDRTVEAFKTVDEALDAAAKIGCKVVP